ncbi:hypothetical protein FRB98_002745 [Tulasnella sp. 332]|nr:hypothetical protein FRB98_002745 [Tulasnella sp. 332]
MSGHYVPNPPTDQPYVPSPVERKCFLFGLDSEAEMIARSNSAPWMEPTGPEAYLEPKELSPLGDHPLDGVWEDQAGPAMADYLSARQVQWTLLHPVRLGIVDQGSPLPFVMVGVSPNTLSAEDGLGIAVYCRSILEGRGIQDIHVILYESRYQPLASMYKPALTSNAVHQVREPFSTSLGIPISYAKTPYYEGTGGFFFLDSAKPGKLFLLTARHVLFHPDHEKNDVYKFRGNSGDAKRNVLLMGTAAFQRYRDAIQTAVDGQQLIIDHQERRVEDAGALEDEEEADAELRDAEAVIEKAKADMEAFKKLLADVVRDCFDGPDGGFTEDFAVVEVDPRMISKANFIANAIDVGSVAADQLTRWMHPHPANPNAFKYPGNRLHTFFGTVPDGKMWKPDARSKDQDDDPVITVMKNGNATGFTVSQLSTIRAFVRHYFEGKPGATSKEVVVLSRSSKSGPFSAKGDSGSVVVSGKKEVCGVLTGGHGTDVCDITLVTSINWLVKRLAFYGIHANIFPTKDDI